MTFRDELEKILIRFYVERTKTGNSVDRVVQEALTSIINLVDKDIIGEDEFEGSPELIGKHARNNLRAEQRNKLKEK